MNIHDMQIVNNLYAVCIVIVTDIYFNPAENAYCIILFLFA